MLIQIFILTYQIIRRHDPEYCDMNLHLSIKLNSLLTPVFAFPTQHNCGTHKTNRCDNRTMHSMF